MGIPKFARFLITRYPLILKKLKEESDSPEIDNLFLDINGVIHKRAHNNNVITMCKERTHEEIFYNIFTYVDELVHLTKPTKLLMISADGVAPRAKMNQQRTRRFRKTDVNKKEQDALRKQGLNPEKMFNSDVISAGTEFMFKLSKAFDQFVLDKINSDPLWKDLKVVLTGVDVPGEGEHKIVEYIRQYKNNPDYDPNAKHCIYGLDADLIMLSLITHEPNICILREEVFGSKKNASDSMARSQMKICENFELIYISILREYLELEFLELKPKLKFEYNIERVIDDFIFFCFFIGNDFLPNLNTLDIDHGALEHIFVYYKEVLPTLDDYITYHGKIDFKKAEKIFACLAGHEMNTLQSMLKKVESNCQMRDKKRDKAIEDRKKLLKVKKLNTKKEKLLINLKNEKNESEIVNFKKDKINKKITKFRQNYESEVLLKGGKAQFEEDLKIFMQKEIDNQIKLIHEKTDMNRQNLKDNENYSESNLDMTETSHNDQDSRKNNKQNYNNYYQKKKNQVTLEQQKGLTVLFDSDDENSKKEKTENYQHKPQIQIDNISRIMKNASKFNKYIQDEAYCSDINIDDIDDGDVSQVSEPEIEIDEVFEDGFNKKLADNQDLDKVFQQKLLNYYITDVNKAKAFYYKEKLGIDLETPSGKEEHKNMFRKYLEGLQWVLFYYYRGIQSWRWYYPYHYAPMISDFNNVREFIDYDMEKIFTYDEPYLPFQSLLFILPKTSKNLFPSCYHGIFDDYPELFPMKFGIDFNGKKMPWESVVLLPFLEEKLVLDYEAKKREIYHPNNKNSLKDSELDIVLSDYDLERNIHGTSYIFSRNSSGEINKKQFEIYSKLNEVNLDSNYSKKVVDYKFPTLKSLNYDYTFDLKKVFMGKQQNNTRNNPSQVKRNKTITIKPIFNHHSVTEDKIKRFVENGTCYINYPFKQEALIRGIAYNNCYYFLNSHNKILIDSRGKVTPEVRDIIKKDWAKKGVSLENTSIFVDVSVLKKIVRNCDGTLYKLYEDSRFYTPFEITSLNSHTDEFAKLMYDYQLLENRFKVIDSEFSNSSPTLILSKISYGHLAKMEKLIKNNSYNYDKYNEENYAKYYDKNVNYDLESKDWEVPLQNIYNGPLIEVSIKNSYQSSLVTDPGVAIKLLEKEEDEYITLEELARKMNISTWALSLLTSSLFVVNCTSDEEIEEDAKLSELEHWNLGLNLRSKGKLNKLVLPGYTRYIEDSANYGEAFCWEFSKFAVDLLIEYKSKFEFVFDCLEKYKNLYNRSNKFFRVYELFANVEDFFERLTDVAVWINSQETSTMGFTSCKSTFLSVNICRKIEEYIENKNKISRQNDDNFDNSHSMVLNPNYIFQETLPYIPPFIAEEPNPFKLGDRVVNIRSNGKVYVPFGLKGTVTAVSNDFIEVLFDDEFMGGSTLNGRLRKRKGAYVNPIDLINITVKNPVYTRRNRDKYYTWDFKYACGNYDGVYAYSYSLEKSKREVEKTFNQLTVKKTHSEILKEKNDTNILEKNKSFQPENGQETAEKLLARKEEAIKAMKVIRKQSDYYNNIESHNYPSDKYKKESAYKAGEASQSQQSNYVPKKIITKEQGKYGSSFKTHPDGARTMPNVQYVNNEKKTQNVSEYRNNRIFKNEDLNKHQIYYYNYGGNKDQSKLAKNNNVIPKGNY